MTITKKVLQHSRDFAKKRSNLVVASVAVYVLYATVLGFLFRPTGWGLLFYILPPVLYELVLRLFLRLTLGRDYYHWLFPYFFVDHEEYGFAFRKNSSSKNVPFLICDEFVFRPGVVPSLDFEENKKQRVDFNVNSLGFRGPEFSPQKNDQNTIRIFTIGDSTTVGNRVDDNETWPALLEQELRARGIMAQVINGGVGAWSSYQQWLRFKGEIVRYEADIVLLNQGWNEEFWYSVQNLGKNWDPYFLLNTVELKSLYARVGPILSSTISLFLHFLVISYFYNVRFKKQRDFMSPSRWGILKAEAYLVGWFDNLINFAKSAQERNIKLYTINAPSLIGMEDKSADRDLYVRLAKVTTVYADYLAVSKKRMSKTLLEADRIIPCLDVEQELGETRGQPRLDFFYDKIHMTPKGNQAFAGIVCERLLADGAFSKPGSNISLDEQTVQSIRKKIGKNEPRLNEFIDQHIRCLSKRKK